MSCFVAKHWVHAALLLLEFLGNNKAESVSDKTSVWAQLFSPGNVGLPLLQRNTRRDVRQTRFLGFSIVSVLWFFSILKCGDDVARALYGVSGSSARTWAYVFWLHKQQRPIRVRSHIIYNIRFLSFDRGNICANLLVIYKIIPYDDIAKINNTS